MNNCFKILLATIFCVSCFAGLVQSQNPENGLVLFTDRDYCVSGDTVWFMAWQPGAMSQLGNVVRVHLDGSANNLIAAAAKTSENGWAEGFIHVPDSLSTGQYFLTAFLNGQRNLRGMETQSIALLVYNRFEEQVNTMELAFVKKMIHEEGSKYGISISTNKESYATRENVRVKITGPAKLQNAAVKVGIVDPLAEKVRGRYNFNLQSSNPAIPDFKENNGYLLSGKVVDQMGAPQKNKVVILSIAGDPPYFDYYFTGDKGDFHFFLKGARGMARMVLQVVSETDNEYFIRPEENYLTRTSELKTETKILTAEQSGFIQTIIDANFMHKLFNPDFGSRPLQFEMPPRYPMPFYGKPHQRIVLADYIDLPDFREIARELMPGFQYRIKKDGITFRLISYSRNAYLEDEPLRLINGIPVFKNSFLAPLKSTDIEYIDLVQEERIFGDLRFKGVLSVVLQNKDNLWMAQQPGVAQFNINCLQPQKQPGYLQPQTLPHNMPDTRQLFHWGKIDLAQPVEIQFNLSDLKGAVEITVEGVDAENKFFRTSKTIQVK